MSRYIDADVVKKNISKVVLGINDFAEIVRDACEEAIDSTPTIEIVRCKDCKYFDESNQDCYRPIHVEPNGGCTYGDTEKWGE